MSIETDVCQAFEKREGLSAGHARIRRSDVDFLAWVAVPPAEGVVEVYVDGGPSLAAAGRTMGEAFERLLAHLEGRPVPPV